MSPVNGDISPLVLYRSYEKGLLPTPKIRPLRRVIWVPHPVLEIEQALKLSRERRSFTLLCESDVCPYESGLFLKCLISVYGEKIARLMFDPKEAQKANLENVYTPRTRFLYDVLQAELIGAIRNACEEPKKGRAHQRCRRRNTTVSF